MAPLPGVVEALGLRGAAVHDLGRFEAAQARSAMDAEPYVTSEDEETDRRARGDHLDYVCDHGLRSLGLVALFDQDAAGKQAGRLAAWLRDADSPAWPLAYATAVIIDEDLLAHQLLDAPPSAARDLALCLVPLAMDVAGPSQRPGRRWSRAALAPYGVDLDLLRLVVRGRTAGVHPARVSDMSVPALTRTLFAGIESALDEARQDRYHWSTGTSVVQATDPEILLVARSCLRSPLARDATLSLPGELPLCRAVVQLVEEVGP